MTGNGIAINVNMNQPFLRTLRFVRTAVQRWKVGGVEMSEQMITNVLILINILILIFRVRRLEKRIKQLEGR